MIGKDAELTSGAAAHLFKRLGGERRDDLLAVLEAGNEIATHAPEDGGRYPVRMVEAEPGGNAGTHRVTDDGAALDAQVVHQVQRVLGHVMGEVELRVVELAAGAVAAIVEGDRFKSGGGEGLDPAGVDPVDLARRTEAVDQEHGLALAVCLVSYGDAIGMEGGHLGLRVGSWGLAARGWGGNGRADAPAGGTASG